MHEDSVTVATFTVATVVGIVTVQNYKLNQFIWPVPRVIHILCKNWHCLFCCWSDIEGRGTCRYHDIDIKVLSYGFNFNKKLWAYYNVWWAPLTCVIWSDYSANKRFYHTVVKHDLCLWSTILWLTQIGVCGLKIGNNFRNTVNSTSNFAFCLLTYYAAVSGGHCWYFMSFVNRHSKLITHNSTNKLVVKLGMRIVV